MPLPNKKPFAIVFKITYTQNIIVVIFDRIYKFVCNSECGFKKGVTNETRIVEAITVKSKKMRKNTLSTIYRAIILIELFSEKINRDLFPLAFLNKFSI